MALCLCSHIDDDNGELTNFTFDTVKFKTIKDCSLDKIPDVPTLFTNYLFSID